MLTWEAPFKKLQFMNICRKMSRFADLGGALTKRGQYHFFTFFVFSKGAFAYCWLLQESRHVTLDGICNSCNVPNGAKTFAPSFEPQ